MQNFNAVVVQYNLARSARLFCTNAANEAKRNKLMRYLVLPGFFTVGRNGRGNWTEGKYPTLAGAREKIEVFSETDNANNTFGIFLAGEPTDPENNADFVRGNVNIGFGRGSVARVSRCCQGAWLLQLVARRVDVLTGFPRMRRLATSSTPS